jgi:aldehyde dehydrogenase (NAD+)
MTPDSILKRLGLTDDPRCIAPDRLPKAGSPGLVVSSNPATQRPIAGVTLDSRDAYDRAIARTVAAFREWRLVPAPQRGEIVRRIGEEFRRHKDDLGALVTLEVGKILPEGRGEVQECIDIADFALGLSRQCYGLTMPSERRDHRLMEQWHPLGPVGVITAFNFPIAVWAWNAMLAAVCGDTVVWKPSLIAPLTALAGTRIVHAVMREQEIFRPKSSAFDATDVFPLVMGLDSEIGETMVADNRLPLISATGSTRMGKRVGQVVAGRLGRALLELGGNNAIILDPGADMELALRAILFGAVGTAGQRCTSTRRLICLKGAKEKILPRLVKSYAAVRIGDPLAEGTLMGPLINEHAVANMVKAIERAEAEGCRVLCGGLPGVARFKGAPGHFVEPTIIDVPAGRTPAITCEETFAPILYVFEVNTLDDALALHNAVPQGLSSAIFTDNVRAAERFLSPAGSDCGIANVNLGTSGAEIGGAFGGEKDTGGGRESGSDAWKAYMRRQTNTINYGSDMPLAQGIRFE